MRWIQIREAKINREVREMFERYRVAAMQVAVVGDGKIGTFVRYHEENVNAVLDWLTGQYEGRSGKRRG